MPARRQSRATLQWLLAGALLFAVAFALAQAAHEPEPLQEEDMDELDVLFDGPEPGEQQQQQKEQQENKEQKQQQQQQQQEEEEQKEEDQEQPQQEEADEEKEEQQPSLPSPPSVDDAEQQHQLKRLERLEKLMNEQLTSEQQPNTSQPLPSPSPAPRMATVLPLMPMVLPGCPYDGILDSGKPWDFPKNWGSMSLEQQALHPINLLFMNLVGVPSTDMMSMVNPCLYSWGVIKGSVTKIVKDYKVGNSMTMKTVVLVFRTKKNVWVVFRSTDDDWAADFDCMYTDDLRKKLNVPTPLLGGKKLQLHRGFWAAYKAVDKQLFQEVNKQLRLVKASNPFHKPQIWIAGHSLGGALATITAFKMTYDPWFNGDIAGVVTYGSPRVGNEEWQQLYQDRLLDITLRWSNHRDLFAALPAKGQFCLSSSPLKTVFNFRHVGKAVLLCPSSTQPGLQEFKFFPKGTETSCKTGETLIIGTHLLGHYFDGWRRAYAHMKGFAAATLLSGGPHVRSVMCSQCATAVKPYPLPDNKAARNDGVVTCVDNKSCNNKELFSVVSWAGLFPTAFFRTDAVCDMSTALCQVPSAALTQVQNKLLEIAPNITAAVGTFASKALQKNPVAQFIQGIAALNSTSGLLPGPSDAASLIDAAAEDNGGLDGLVGDDDTEDTTVGVSSTPARVATAAGVAVTGYVGDELVVEPTVDGHMQVIEPPPAVAAEQQQKQQHGDHSSTGSSSTTKRKASKHVASGEATVSVSGVHSSSGRNSTRKAHSKHQQAAASQGNNSSNSSSNNSSLVGTASVSTAAASQAGPGSSIGEPQPAQIATAALRSTAKGTRPKVVDVVSGFVAGFFSQLQSKQQQQQQQQQQ